MKKIVLIIVLVIILVGLVLIFSPKVFKIPYLVSKTYKVKIVNESNFEITDIYLRMVGGEGTISLDKLAVRESTEYYQFSLKKTQKDVVQISYGDYSGSYKQGGTEKRIFIPRPKKVIEIVINDNSFSVR